MTNSSYEINLFDSEISAFLLKLSPMMAISMFRRWIHMKKDIMTNKPISHGVIGLS